MEHNEPSALVASATRPWREGAKELSQARIFSSLAVVCLLGCFSCNNPYTGRRLSTGALILTQPDAVKIVEAFTEIKDHDQDGAVDSLDVYLQMTNPFDEPTRAVGKCRFELFEFLQASGDNRGSRLAQWDIPLDKESDQKKHWNRATQMYEFRLALDLATAAPDRQYVLEAAYSDPISGRRDARARVRTPTGARLSQGR